MALESYDATPFSCLSANGIFMMQLMPKILYSSINQSYILNKITTSIVAHYLNLFVTLPCISITIHVLFCLSAISKPQKNLIYICAP